MRHLVREQSYIDPELNRQVQAYEAKMGWKHSAFTREAYQKLLAADRGDRDLVMRRLDALVRGMEAIQGTLELMGMTVAFLARICFRHLDLSTSTPDSVQTGESSYRELLRAIGSNFKAGRRLSGEIFPASVDNVPPRPGSGAGGGWKGPGR